MMNGGKVSKSVDAYIRAHPATVQKMLQSIRQTIKKTAPKVVESISYMMPAYKFNRKPLAYFGGYAKHIGFYPTSSGTVAFKKELSKYKTDKGTVQFQLDKPIPLGLVKKMVTFRMKEILKSADKKSGTKSYIHFHNDGSIWAKGKITAGKMDGAWVWFRKDGSKMRAGSFKKGKQVGTWTTYDKSGKAVKTTKMK